LHATDDMLLLGSCWDGVGVPGTGHWWWTTDKTSQQAAHLFQGLSQKVSITFLSMRLLELATKVDSRCWISDLFHYDSIIVCL